jgi:hypothetical protein
MHSINKNLYQQSSQKKILAPTHLHATAAEKKRVALPRLTSHRWQP